MTPDGKSFITINEHHQGRKEIYGNACDLYDSPDIDLTKKPIDKRLAKWSKKDYIVAKVIIEIPEVTVPKKKTTTKKTSG